MDKQLLQVIEHVLLRGMFFILFTLTLIFTAVFTLDFLNVLYSTPQELKKWPWGWEGGGWAYSSSEVYIARGQRDSYIGWQGLIVSAVFYRLGRVHIGYKVIAVAILAAPVCILILASDGFSG